MNHKIIISLLLASGCAFAFARPPLYKDAGQPVEKRVEDLMSRMTLEEKIAQMSQFVGPNHIRENQQQFKDKGVAKNDDAYGFYPTLSVNDLYRMTQEGKIGSFLHVVTAEEANELQRLASKSRLGIPLIIGIDAIHGNALVSGTTVYPTPIGQASTFNEELVERLSRESAGEVRAGGAHWTFTPNVDVARDARWGRVGETFGEDPWLVSRMGVATVRGYQGARIGNNSVLACAKHLIAGSEPSNGTNAAPMDVSERTLREVFLPPYKAAVQEAGVATLMAAHNELNGIPCHADRWMMTDIMRDEYGFDGFIVSDWMDVSRIHDLHHAALDLDDAYRQAVEAGLDMNMHGPGFAESILKQVEAGTVSKDVIDRACRAILTAKFNLGLFENPYVDLSDSKKTLFNANHRKTALKAAEQSIVLLKNANNLLPLDLSKINRIFVTGPNADNQTILGDWTLPQPDENVTTVLEGLRRVAGKGKVTYYDYGDDVRQNSPVKVKEAAAMAREADVAIVVVGENPLRYQKGKTCGENTDRMNLELLGTQEQLVIDIAATGVPTIVVLTGGRPLAIPEIDKKVSAVLQAWEPGSEGGLAVAEIIAGQVNPSAKLPVSMPYSSGQIQMIYNHKPSQYFHKYKDGPSKPLYPFGYGLSYTDFTISEPVLDKTVASTTDTVKVTATVTNIGLREGSEVVQLYIRDDISTVTRPVKELKDFVRVSLKPGESRTVEFDITPEKLAFFDRNMKYSVEPGDFTVMVGSSSLDKDLKTTCLTIK